jgi:hypothetical protein
MVYNVDEGVSINHVYDDILESYITYISRQTEEKSSRIGLRSDTVKKFIELDAQLSALVER